MWIFGYGSLIWRPSLPFVQSSPAFVEGFARRLWQGSPDHRGVPEAPGRVVTLVEEESSLCWGRAYRVAEEHIDKVVERLDVREQGGYEQRRLDVHLRPSGESRAATTSGKTAPGLVYIATPTNPCYLGPAPAAEIAAQVSACRGPSGTNVEYVERLVEALAELGAPPEQHLLEVLAGLEGVAGTSDR